MSDLQPPLFIPDKMQDPACASERQRTSHGSLDTAEFKQEKMREGRVPDLQFWAEDFEICFHFCRVLAAFGAYSLGGRSYVSNLVVSRVIALALNWQLGT